MYVSLDKTPVSGMLQSSHLIWYWKFQFVSGLGILPLNLFALPRSFPSFWRRRQSWIPTQTSCCIRIPTHSYTHTHVSNYVILKNTEGKLKSSFVLSDTFTFTFIYWKTNYVSNVELSKSKNKRDTYVIYENLIFIKTEREKYQFYLHTMYWRYQINFAIIIINDFMNLST